MGLQFYVGEIQAQINEATRMNSEAQQAISTLQTSISQFLSAPLSGKAYTSAKNYFSVAFTPLCRSAIMTGEALAQAHKKLLSEYQGSVSSIDTNEDEILEQINQFEQLKRSLEEQMRTAKTMRPDLEKRYMNACECIKQRREKLQKFHDYNSKSASFFSAFDSSLSEFKAGLAQVQQSKAWNASTGTFDLGLLDMSWAVGINERWEQREKMKQEQLKKAQEYKTEYLAQYGLTENDLVQVTDSPEVVAEKYAKFSKLGLNPHTGMPLEGAETWQFGYSSYVSRISQAAGLFGSAYTVNKAFPQHSTSSSTFKGSKNGTNYTLDKNKSTGNFKYTRAPQIPIKELESLPNNVSEAFNKYNGNDWRGNVAGQSEGTKAGKSYKNRDNKLPAQDSDGNKIDYKEYDVNDKIPNMNRDAERLVRGSDGNVYYTNDHYKNFIKIK